MRGHDSYGKEGDGVEGKVRVRRARGMKSNVVVVEMKMREMKESKKKERENKGGMEEEGKGGWMEVEGRV